MRVCPDTKGGLRGRMACLLRQTRAIHSSKAAEQLAEVHNGETFIQITQWINQLSKFN